MTSSILFQSLASILLLCSIYCHEHHNNDGDKKWSVFVSHIQSFWKTEPSESQTESFVPTKTRITEKDSSHYHHSHKNTDENTNSHTPRIEIMNGTSTFNDVKQGVQLSLAWLISLPLVGLIVLFCFCYCCCKCCASMCSEDKVVVMNQHVIAPLQQPQVIVQQPIIQNMVAPREMQQYPPPPQNPQWGHPQNFQHPMPPPQYYPAGGVDNPNFHYPTAPNNMSPDKY